MVTDFLDVSPLVMSILAQWRRTSDVCVVLDIRHSPWHIDDSRCAVHGAGLSPEDLDKPQVRER